MTKGLDLLVFIGRFQPFHKGHEHVIHQALKKADKVLVLIGSANVAPSLRNPWGYAVRRSMIADSSVIIADAVWSSRLHFDYLNDNAYNDTAWIAEVQEKAARLSTGKIGLVGYEKDHTSYYLKMFPDWGSVNIDPPIVFASTDIREQYFSKAPSLPVGICPKNVVDFLEQFMTSPEFPALQAEAIAIRDYKKSWENSPFPPTFVTVDNVVVQSGHILLITRGEQPGKGLLAFPGGFLGINETIVESAVRELKEETRIADHIGEMPPAKLKSFITKRDVFDDPNRSTRGRTITHAFLYELPKATRLYEVKGSDDAVDAQWYPIGTVTSNRFFEDHYFIMQKMLGLSS